ncbi:MAG: bifunctional biotin--[acetyl-CoA-carboxylase] ligase/biotin operon repressor BirA [Gammaproteobacteria bacterium]|nr:bifunctional biotin--[acetyl-CoA-carboxylase] ligase/biotin operon repressor BirA [Gammaproteobacteria bacterium]
MQSALRQQLLQHLADGACYSGSWLGEQLGMSRAAVWKHIQHLQAEGVPIQAIVGRGYQLAQRYEALDAEQIHAARQFNVPLELIILDKVDSTNAELLRRRSLLQISDWQKHYVCLAEQQSAGRGRRGRVWHTSWGASLALSYMARLALAPMNLAGLSLVIGMAVVDVLRVQGVSGAGLKWPNDILVDGAKLGGILIDLSAEANGPSDVVIGVGLNITASANAEMQNIEQAWTDLYSITQKNYSRNQLSAALLDSFAQNLHRFEQYGFVDFISAWPDYDVLQHKTIQISQGERSFSGLAQGVDEQGALCVATFDGIKKVTAGEVSVRVNS